MEKASKQLFLGASLSMDKHKKVFQTLISPSFINHQLTRAILESNPHCISPKTVQQYWANLSLKSLSSHLRPAKMVERSAACTDEFKIHHRNRLWILLGLNAYVPVRTFQSVKVFCKSWGSSSSWYGYTCSINILTALRRCHMHLKMERLVYQNQNS